MKSIGEDSGRIRNTDQKFFFEHFKCPLTEEWIKKMWYIYAKEYYSAIKNPNEINVICCYMDGPRDYHTK